MSQRRNTIKSHLIHLIAKRLKINQKKIDEKTCFINDLEIDSLTLVELIIDAEEAFDLAYEITDEKTATLTVGEVIEYFDAARTPENPKNSTESDGD